MTLAATPRPPLVDIARRMGAVVSDDVFWWYAQTQRLVDSALKEPIQYAVVLTLGQMVRILEDAGQENVPVLSEPEATPKLFLQAAVQQWLEVMLVRYLNDRTLELGSGE